MKSAGILAALLLAAVAGRTVAAASAQQGRTPTISVLDKAFTLEEAQRLALLNDARLLTAAQDTIIADERVREAKYQFFPEIGLQASATKYEARYPFALGGEFRNILLFPDRPGIFRNNDSDSLYSGRGYFQMTLYEGGRGWSTLKLAQAGQKQARSNHDSVKMDLALSVREAFFRLLLAQERVALTDALLASVEDAVRGGRLDGWDRVEAEARVAEARGRSSEAAHNLELRRLEFLKILNLELDTPFKLIGTLDAKPVEVDIDKAVLWAMELRPELQSETYKAQMDEISVNLAQQRRIPTVFLASDYELTDSELPMRNRLNNWAATVGVRIPISYDYWSQLKQRRAEQRQGQLKRAELQDNVRLQVRRAYADLVYWQKETPLRETQWKRVQSLYDTAARGAGGALGRARSLAGVVDLKLAYLTAVTEQILAVGRFERAVGRRIGP